MSITKQIKGIMEEIKRTKGVCLGVKIKKMHKDAVIPSYAKEGDAGLDLTATSVNVDEYGCICYGTGLAFEIPEGYVGLVFPRSSNCKKGIALTNCVGVIDSGYRGEVSFKFRPLLFKASEIDNRGWFDYDMAGLRDAYKVGERVGQIIIMPYPRVEFEEVDELSETERGGGSYGSTGK